MTDLRSIEDAASVLIDLYDQPFGGKERGRFRVSMKLLAQLLGQRRVWPEEMEAIARTLYQRGFICIDMESFVVILSQKTFTNYRRANEAAIGHVGGSAERERSLA